VDAHLTRTHGQQPHHGLEERGLAGTVGTHHRHLRRVGHYQRDPLQGRPVAIGHGEVMQFEQAAHRKASTMRVTLLRIMSR